jgi:hypothetical protein
MTSPTPLMLTPMFLRTLIVNALGDKLGVYLFPKATTSTAAIAVIPDKIHGSNYPPPETTVSGIEVVIHSPRPSALARLGNGSMRTRKWEIYLNQWDNNGDLNTAVEYLINAFQDNQLQFTSPVFPDYNLDTGIVPYCRIAIIERFFRIVEEM